MAQAKMFFDHKNHTYWFEDEAVETQVIRNEKEFLAMALKEGLSREGLDGYYLTYEFAEPIKTEAERKELLSQFKTSRKDSIGRPKRLTKDAAAKKENISKREE